VAVKEERGDEVAGVHRRSRTGLAATTSLSPMIRKLGDEWKALRKKGKGK
jgi:hypothetical protein